MIIGIDGSNLRQGGGLTHIIELLSAGEPDQFGIKKIIIWSGKNTIDRIEDRGWLIKKEEPLLNKSIIFRLFWQKIILRKLLILENCDLLFVPGGTDASGFQPMVTMCRNMLPFEWKEMFRFGLSRMTIKLFLLRFSQLLSFKNATGLIFLTKYAESKISPLLNHKQLQIKVIPHGIDKRFFKEPRLQRNISEFNEEFPFKLIYVSIIDVYKHHTNVVIAVTNLRKKGYPVILELIGPNYKPEMKKLLKMIKKVDPHSKFINYLGSVDHQHLNRLYLNANLNIFASSCENMPNILLEGMASGLPIACSNMGPMPEILKDGGLYFNPEIPQEIEYTIEDFLLNVDLRRSKSKISFEEAKNYSWNECAKNTFQFLSDVYSQRLEFRS